MQKIKYAVNAIRAWKGMVIYFMKPVNLQVQGLTSPLGLDTKCPQFSCNIAADKQDEYINSIRFIASSSEEAIKRGIGDLWDTGFLNQNNEFSLQYSGKALKSRQRVFWRVYCEYYCNKSNKMSSSYSNIEVFEMGLLDKNDWKAEWIGQGDKYADDKSKAIVLKKSFNMPCLSTNDRIRAYISGLGVFEAKLNGKKISDTYFDPGETDASKRVMYVTYDLMDYVVKDENVIEITLGNGQYTGYTINPVMLLNDGNPAPQGRYQKNDSCFVKPGICGDKKTIAQIELIHEDGSKELLEKSDESWSLENSPTVFQNWYGGEDYDSNLENTGLDEHIFQMKNLGNAVRMSSPGGMLCARECEPIKVYEENKAVSVRKLDNGNYLVDFGNNGAGVPLIRIFNTDLKMKGQWVCMYPAENLQENGCGVDQRSCTQSWSERYNCDIKDSYCISGKGNEGWTPKFCYQGFQYIEIEGFPGEPSTDNFSALRIRNNNRKNGSFYSSNELVNSICSMTERSIESNMYWSFTDCPQIEKLGWIETSHLMFQSVACVFDIRAWMKKIIKDLEDSVTDESQAALPGNEAAGFVPGIVPEFYRINGLYKDPNWNGACIFTPWEYYQFYGDISVLNETFPMMEAYIGYLDKVSSNGLLENYAQMGEWGEYGEHTPNVLVASAAYFRLLSVTAQIAALINRNEKAVYYRNKAEQTREAFWKHPKCNVFLDETVKSQASYGCIVFSKLADEEQRLKCIEELSKAVIKNDYHITSGEVGLRQVFAALSENGRSDLVYKMIVNQKIPGYGFFAKEGLTTLPEYWNYKDLWNGMVRSGNHAMMGHVRGWLTIFLAGIRPLTPGWKYTLFSPYYPSDMDYANASVFTPFGLLSVGWKKIQCKESSLHKNIMMEISVPVGISVKVEIPNGDSVKIKQISKGKHSFLGSILLI